MLVRNVQQVLQQNSRSTGIFENFCMALALEFFPLDGKNGEFFKVSEI